VKASIAVIVAANWMFVQGRWVKLDAPFFADFAAGRRRVYL
jgi:hypothetical protein